MFLRGVSLKWMKSRMLRKKKTTKKKVKTIASFASVRHHGWRMQAAWTNLVEFMRPFVYLFILVSFH